MTPLERITVRVNRLGDLEDPATPRPLLTIDEFFDGNDVDGSIGCNLVPMPTPGEVAVVLRAIAARPEVADVRVQVTFFDTPEWPFSDTVYVVTTASPAEVQSWFPPDLAPDESAFVTGELETCEPYQVAQGHAVIYSWWD